jgi:hypothetical protein
VFSAHQRPQRFQRRSVAVKIVDMVRKCKFHGSQAKLQKPLEALRAFCEEHGYARSTAKIQRMLDTLVKEGFASFA